MGRQKPYQRRRENEPQVGRPNVTFSHTKMSFPPSTVDAVYASLFSAVSSSLPSPLPPSGWPPRNAVKTPQREKQVL